MNGQQAVAPATNVKSSSLGQLGPSVPIAEESLQRHARPPS